MQHFPQWFLYLLCTDLYQQLLQLQLESKPCRLLCGLLLNSCNVLSPFSLKLSSHFSFLSESTYTVYTRVKGMSSLFFNYFEKKVLDSGVYVWYTGRINIFLRVVRDSELICRRFRTPLTHVFSYLFSIWDIMGLLGNAWSILPHLLNTLL